MRGPDQLPRSASSPDSRRIVDRSETTRCAYLARTDVAEPRLSRNVGGRHFARRRSCARASWARASWGSGILGSGILWSDILGSDILCRPELNRAFCSRRSFARGFWLGLISDRACRTCRTGRCFCTGLIWAWASCTGFAWSSRLEFSRASWTGCGWNILYRAVTGHPVRAARAPPPPVHLCRPPKPELT